MKGASHGPTPFFYWQCRNRPSNNTGRRAFKPTWLNTSPAVPPWPALRAALIPGGSRTSICTVIGVPTGAYGHGTSLTSRRAASRRHAADFGACAFAICPGSTSHRTPSRRPPAMKPALANLRRLSWTSLAVGRAPSERGSCAKSIGWIGRSLEERPSTLQSKPPPGCWQMPAKDGPRSQDEGAGPPELFCPAGAPASKAAPGS